MRAKHVPRKRYKLLCWWTELTDAVIVKTAITRQKAAGNQVGSCLFIVLTLLPVIIAVQNALQPFRSDADCA